MKWIFHAVAASGPIGLSGHQPVGEVLRVLVGRPTVRVEQRRLADGSLVFYKRYAFPFAGARLAAAFRHTWLATPKVEREVRNLLRLRAAGLSAPRPLAWAVARDRLGFVRDSWLLLPWIAPGLTLEDRLRAGGGVDAALWPALGEAIARLHRAGCFYRHLAPRNLLLDEAGRFHFVDPARSRWTSPPLAPGACVADLALFLRPALHLLPPGAAEEVLRAHGGVPLSPEDLLAAVPSSLRRRCRRWIAREEARLRVATGAPPPARRAQSPARGPDAGRS